MHNHTVADSVSRESFNATAYSTGQHCAPNHASAISAYYSPWVGKWVPASAGVQRGNCHLCWM